MTRPDRLSDAELSALVAEKVYGITDEPIDDCLSYATDSGLALEAALKVATEIHISSVGRMCRARVAGFSWTNEQTVARAICRAALRVIGIEVEGDS